MKKFIIFSLIMVFSFTYGQKNESSIFISNSKHFELSVFFKKGKLKKRITKYVLVVEIKDFGKYDFSSKVEAKLAGLSGKHSGTGIYFYVNKNPCKLYAYPVSEQFMNKRFSKIYPQLKNAEKLKIYFNVYKTDLTPIVIIERIKVLD